MCGYYPAEQARNARAGCRVIQSESPGPGPLCFDIIKLKQMLMLALLRLLLLAEQIVTVTAVL